MRRPVLSVLVCCSVPAVASATSYAQQSVNIYLGGFVPVARTRPRPTTTCSSTT